MQHLPSIGNTELARTLIRKLAEEVDADPSCAISTGLPGARRLASISLLHPPLFSVTALGPYATRIAAPTISGHAVVLAEAETGAAHCGDVSNSIDWRGGCLHGPYVWGSFQVNILTWKMLNAVQKSQHPSLTGTGFGHPGLQHGALQVRNRGPRSTP